MDTEDQSSKTREKERKGARAEPPPSHYRKENGAPEARGDRNARSRRRIHCIECDGLREIKLKVDYRI